MKYTIKCSFVCVLFIHVACLRMCVLFYFSFVTLHVCAHAFKFKVHCGSAFEPGASGLLNYCTPPVCVPVIIGGLTGWWHNNNQKKKAWCVPAVIGVLAAVWEHYKPKTKCERNVKLLNCREPWPLKKERKKTLLWHASVEVAPKKLGEGWTRAASDIVKAESTWEDPRAAGGLIFDLGFLILINSGANKRALGRPKINWFNQLT